MVRRGAELRMEELVWDEGKGAAWGRENNRTFKGATEKVSAVKLLWSLLSPLHPAILWR